MKRTKKGLALAAVVTLVAVAPAAGAPRSRTETVAYERPTGAYLAETVLVDLAFGPMPEAAPQAREKTVSITLEDDSGRPVAGVAHQGDEELGAFCGHTETPLALVNRKPVHVHVYSGEGCADVTLPTTGSVTFTFTR